MRISRCTRCDQLIEYDDAHEGEEVLCPGCDNITRLKEIPPGELPPLDGAADGEDSSGAGRPRAPMRIPADELPKPAEDPVAPKTPAEEGERGPGRARREAEEAKAREPAKDDPGPSVRKVQPVGGLSADKIPPGQMPEIRIVEGTDSISFFGGDTGDSADGKRTITLRPNLAIAIILLLVGIVLYIKFGPTEKNKAARAQKATMEMRASIEARKAAMRAEPVVLPSVPPPADEPAPVPMNAPVSRPMVEVSMDDSSGGSSTPRLVEVTFPALPKVIRRTVDDYQDQAYQAYVESALSMPYRLFENTVTDLRTLGFALKQGMTEFDENWRLIGGLVAGRQDDGLLLRLDRRYFTDGTYVLVSGFPAAIEVQKNMAVGMLVRKLASREIELPDGKKEIVATFEFGLLPSRKMIEVVDEQARIREARNREKLKALAKEKADEEAAAMQKKKAANDRRAVEYLRRKVQEGSASAQYSLGMRYLEGAGVPENRAEALRLLKMAAKQNHYLARKKLKELGQ